MARQRRAGGGVDQLPSGRYRVRIATPDGRRISLGTFATKRAAEAAYARTVTDQAEGRWRAPVRTSETLAEYSRKWLAARLTTRGEPLRPRVRDLYRGQLDRHILPAIGDTACSKITTRMVRDWVAHMRGPDGPGASTAAKCYRLLRSILATAVEDGLTDANPCSIKGAGVEPASERQIPTVAQALALAETIDPRLRSAVHLAAFVGLRKGELLGLRRGDLDFEEGLVRIERQRQLDQQGNELVGPPKSEAGRRVVTIPGALIEHLSTHVASYAERGVDGYVFTGQKGGPLSPVALQTAWDRARRQLGLELLHFHDLRHLAGTLAASTGASTKELMHRLGHAAPQAALRYQHATRERDALIALALDSLILGEASQVASTDQE